MSTQQSYGVEGAPIKVSSDPSTPPPAPTPEAESPTGVVTTFAQGDAPVATQAGDLWVHTGEQFRLYRAERAGADASGGWVEAGDPHVERITKIEQDILALVTVLENRAETTLLRSDYQRGQRDATLGCANDLRALVGK